MFGGAYGYEKSCYSFSTLSQKWTKLPNLPSARHQHRSAIIGNSVFLVGGRGNNAVEKYNTVTKKFTKVNVVKKSAFPAAESRISFGMCVYRTDSLLIASGCPNNKSEITKSCFLLDTKAQTAREVGSLNEGRGGHALVNFEEEVFCIGGSSINYMGVATYFSSIEKFNPVTEEWMTSHLKLIEGRRDHQAVTYKQFIYVLGGRTEKGYTDTIERINVSEGKVEMLDVKLRRGRSVFAVAVVKSDLYIFGSQGGGGSTEVLNLETLEIKEGVEPPESSYRFTACSLWY